MIGYARGRDDLYAERERGEHSPLIDRDQHGDLAEQGDQPERAKSGDALAVSELVALLPAALQADQQADGERDPEAESVSREPGSFLEVAYPNRKNPSKISSAISTTIATSRTSMRRSRATSRTSTSASWMLCSLRSRAAKRSPRSNSARKSS
jgi:hypothetical protein